MLCGGQAIRRDRPPETLPTMYDSPREGWIVAKGDRDLG